MAKAAAGLTAARAKSLGSKGDAGKYAAGAGLYLMVTKPGLAVWAAFCDRAPAEVVALRSVDPAAPAG